MYGLKIETMQDEKFMDRSNSYYIILTIKYTLEMKHKGFLPAGIFSPWLKAAQHTSCFFLRIHHSV